MEATSFLFFQQKDIAYSLTCQAFSQTTANDWKVLNFLLGCILLIAWLGRARQKK